MNENNQLSEKEQEKKAGEKAGQTAVRTGLDAISGGAYSKAADTAEKVPILGKRARKKEEKAGKKLANALDKKTDGNFSKAAKKIDDNGGLDALNQGLSAKNGSNVQNNKPRTSTNNQATPNDTFQKPNFAKNGLSNDGSKVVNNQGNSSSTKGIRDIFNRRSSNNGKDKTNESDSISSDNNESSSSFGNSNNQSFFISASVDKFIKKTILPFIIAVIFIVFITTLIATASNDESDLSAVDPDNTTSKKDNTYYFSNGDSELQDFYNRALKIEEQYNSEGKSINVMYITATYHILEEYQSSITPKSMSDNLIKNMADGMLGNSSVYSEDNYRQYLKNTLFPSYGFSEKKSSKATDRVFEYINEYMKKKNKDNTCTTTTGSSCIYDLKDTNGNKLDLNNLQVRLMSTSCAGGNFGALKEDLVPFEKYILGVGYAEIGTGFNSEAEKVQLIAARSFSLSRPSSMGNSNDVKYVSNNNQNILQMRSCVADQVFCNTDKGCSKDGTDQWNVMYSGTTHSYVYRDSLDNYPNSTLKSSWEETMGVVGVDSDGKVVNMGYTSVNQNRWNDLAKSGMDYTQIILSEYPSIKSLKKANCSNTKEPVDNGFVQVAQKIWREIANGNYSYYMDGLTVPPPKGLVDCSTFISWVLYEYGFKEEFGGYQHNTLSFLTTDWTKNGWTEIPVRGGEDVTGKLQPGDMLVRDDGTGGANGHINIVAEVKDGRIYVYDAGQSSNWLTASAKAGMPIENTNFAKSDPRPGKIIRINNVSGNSCKTAETGEVTSWRQYSPAPWANISLGNSKETIGSAGCFITSIAIQIKRSGVKTSLSEFNPGTFVQELNKYNSFGSSGSFDAPQNILKIVPSFTEVAHAVSLPSDKKGKINTIKSYIDKGYYVILRVKTSSGQHWVAVTGTTNDSIQMIDPGSDATSVWDKYPVNESSTINVYKIN